ncbi:hypothetical protein [Aureimonas frigidaquae]|uniref:hypothetical protein n=1 Tax=Aureimonas frigidaquae TaxID=424757 RepID=UPI00078566A6|nr:hypothetical protein [Aureimonas frigidaquae]
MSTAHPLRFIALAGTLAILSACSSTGSGGSGPGAVAMAAVDPRDCPSITLPDTMAVLRPGSGPDYAYIASITDVTRSCQIENGQITMDVGIAGRVVPAATSRPLQVTLPLRVKATNASGQLYSRAGSVSVAIAPGGPSTFTYVDRGITVPQAGKTGVTAGFDQ